jgi:hypothetical protein
MTVKVWWLGGTPGNFGDILTPYVLDYFKIPYERVRHYKDSNLLCIGSIIRRAGTNKTVLGSGIISQKDKINVDANFNLVRGPITRQQILNLGGECLENYGDPGLLISLIANEQTKKFKVGITPHIVDYHYIKEKFLNGNVINLKTVDPIETAKKISECEMIVSSSLHGIIAAHSYGIPAAWVNSENKLKGGDVKFYDYFASVGIDNPQKSTIEDPVFTLPKIDLKNNIVKAFREFKNEIK